MGAVGVLRASAAPALRGWRGAFLGVRLRGGDEDEEEGREERDESEREDDGDLVGRKGGIVSAAATVKRDEEESSGRSSQDDTPEENSDNYSEISGSVDDSDGPVNYAKFSMTPPVMAPGVCLNEDMSAKEGEISYLTQDPYIGRWGWTPLHRAARQGDDETLGKMLDLGGDPNVETQNGWTPLHEACIWGKTGVVRLLLAKGANASQPTKTGWAALHFAAGSGQMAICQMLLDHGVDKDYPDSYGDRAVDKAMRNEEQRYPCLPIGLPVNASVEERKTVYRAIRELLGANTTYWPSDDRFDVYAKLIEGRRSSYSYGLEELDELNVDKKWYNSAGEDLDEADNPWLTRDDADFLNWEKVREESAAAFNATDLQSMVEKMEAEGERKPPASISTDGVLDEDVAEQLERWKDVEYDRRTAEVDLDEPVIPTG